MNPRVVIFDENEVLSLTLKQILDERGYEVFTFSNGGICPLFLPVDHKRISDNACSDMIITDLYMPTIEGLKLVKDLIDKGCKVKCRALMSTTWSYADWQCIRKLGFRIFRKPFELKEMLEWLDDCAEKINPERKLSDLLTKPN